MGNDIIIMTGDFSTNGFVLDTNVTNIAAQYFQVGKAYNNAGSAQSNSTRCCTGNFTLPAGTIYTKVKMKIKDGFDYVFGIKNNNVIKWYKGNAVETAFNWITDTQEVIAPITSTGILYINFRYDNNTTEFASDTIITDIVEYIILTN